MKSKYLSMFIAFFAAANAHAQNIFPSSGSAGIGTTTPNASSIFEMVSTSKGLLVPRMTKNQRDAIKSPATGLLIYATNGAPGFYYYTGTAWTAVTPKAGWLLTGNASTNPGANFIGTVDAQPLVFKVNSEKAGYLGTSSTGNTAFGYQTLNANTTGVDNTANGLWSMLSNTTGYYNTATGGFSLYTNSDGISNTANGISALRFNTHGSDNTAVGANTLFYNTTGYSNVAVGSNALFNNTTVSNNVAVGDSALFNNGIGAIFYDDGSANVAVGSKALYSNTRGLNNTANGVQALYSNTSGRENTANGVYALYSDTTGSSNTANGVQALYSNTSGSYNTAIGGSALSSNITGSLNTALGCFANVSTGNLANAMALGYGATVNASDKVAVGNTSVMVIGGQVGWSVFSDGRFKSNVKENVPGLAFINKLKPVTYNLDVKKFDKFLGKKDSLINTRQAEYAISEKKVHTGFVAQDVEKSAQEIHYDFDGVNHPQNDKDNYSVVYADFVPSLVKAVQELSKQNDELKKDYTAKIDELQRQIDDLKAMMISDNQRAIISSLSGADVSCLDQNVPNPFSKATTISYSLPQKCSSAKIIVIDESGGTIKTFNLSGTGKGTINFSSPFRVAASYQYSLLVDGKLIDTKQMILAK
jgi:hypothetical protein